MNLKKENQPIYIQDFDYPLPDERIAKFPLSRRDSSKLLVYKGHEISEDVFSNLVGHLPEDSLLVYNNTRVIHARMFFEKQTGARIEIFCLEPSLPADYAQSLGATQDCIWKCMIGNLKKWKSGLLTKTINIKGCECHLSAELFRNEGNVHQVKFTWDDSRIHFADILENAGELPIPPYLHRKTEESDNTTYQTVYSKIEGSVAAPTAGLHFTPEVFESLKKKGIQTAELTLHVGAGTFQPVKTETVDEHTMHAEVIEVSRQMIEQLIAKSGKVIAVGTTSVRTLESLYYIGLQLLQSPGIEELAVSQWQPYKEKETVPGLDVLQAILEYMDRKNTNAIHASTQIIIQPGYRFHIVNGIITNFHQPKSTLLLLVSAFVDGRWKSIYDYALAHGFRFLSYGDSSLLLP